MGRALSVAFVLPYGEPRQSFFPDVVTELACQRARELGHSAHIVRVYYDGREPSRDAQVRRLLDEWLAQRDADVVVVERLFDPEPIRRHVRAKQGRRAVLLSWGDAEAIEGIELVVGLTAGTAHRGITRRSPSGGEIVESFGALLNALSEDADVRSVPGVAQNLDGDRIVANEPGRAAPPPRPFRPILEHDVIALDAPPVVTRKYVLGNAGCPYAADPKKVPFYAGLAMLEEPSLSRLGCAFCHAGGDYQKRADSEVVADIVEQARFYQTELAELEELVLLDQHPQRYLAKLVRAAHEAGLRPLRWLFPARADAFVRELDSIREAVEAARASKQVLEVYLSGFETFSERELVRYNKGVSPRELLSAVEAMRALKRESGGAFEYARARGHSLILWSPWTEPSDLHESAQAIRASGLGEIFREMGRNRLRLYRELPIFHAAERDGALSERWDEGDEGAGRRKGYAVEHPWKFLDKRTRLAYELAQGLRGRLGTSSEVAHLHAVARCAEAMPSANATDIMRGVDALASRLHAIARARGRAPNVRAAVVSFAGECDNRCASCANRDHFLDDAYEALRERIAQARAGGLPLVLAGREPTVHPAFLDLLAAAAADGRDVGIVSNGRRFSDRALARAAVSAGLRSASIKLFAPDAAAADRASGVPGAHAQALDGVEALKEAGVSALELRVALSSESLASMEDFVELASMLGVARLRVEVALDALGLAHLEEACTALDRLCARSREHRLSLDASALSSATRGFERMPV